MRARELADQHEALMVLDEVQTGIGRTGEWFRFQGVNRTLSALGSPGIAPDLMTLAKGLGSGIPIGALVAFGSTSSTLLGAGQHGSTFGGNPLAALAGQVTLETIQAEGLLDSVSAVGARLAEELRALPQTAEVRQFGLHIGADLVLPDSISARRRRLRARAPRSDHQRHGARHPATRAASDPLA
ncbi:aminotransferase class III-fold pyridoxal phosphate-dependent enzyme [Nesterenkonia pannonica]|uniref:aminotransferase class III-fold pyridoxal phosphate-dependent enzyme n=1 Tax=Nesterenkonia pannonica TaxID=1548602 RepID=UPI0021640366|nr:aminotransferase class III-fold pyridoxal phosphate-dependent enzyme [Nesterenkonia pannonica]